MDTSSWVYIGLAAAGGVGTVAWFWIRRVQMGLDSVNGRATQKDFGELKDIVSNLKVDVERKHADMALSINGRAKQADFEALREGFSEFQVECAKNFVSNTALMQVMSSLDRTIQQLTQAITHNAQESREGIKAINDRIDNLMNHRG